MGLPSAAPASLFWLILHVLGRGNRMTKRFIWSDNSPDFFYDPNGMAIDAGGLDAARGLLIGLAISQVFWLALALILF